VRRRDWQIRQYPITPAEWVELAFILLVVAAALLTK
jgi:hypothetical protein